MVFPAKFHRLREHAAANIGDNYHKLGYLIGTDAVEAGTTDTIITATGHAAAVGDEIIMTSGDEDGEAREVTAVDSNTITLEAALSGTPSATETFAIVRPVVLTDPTVWLKFENQCDQPILISFDGSTDHLRLAASGDEAVLDLHQMGRKLGNDRSSPAVGSKGYIYAKVESSSPTSGSLYVWGVS